MKPIDYRDETWRDVNARVSGERLRVLNAWWQYGACTTAELAERSGMSVLSVRPRTTELLELGMVELAGDARGTEGRYRAVPDGVALDRFLNRQRAELQNQMTLQL